MTSVHRRAASLALSILLLGAGLSAEADESPAPTAATLQITTTPTAAVGDPIAVRGTYTGPVPVTRTMGIVGLPESYTTSTITSSPFTINNVLPYGGVGSHDAFISVTSDGTEVARHDFTFERTSALRTFPQGSAEVGQHSQVLAKTPMRAVGQVSVLTVEKKVGDAWVKASSSDGVTMPEFSAVDEVSLAPRTQAYRAWYTMRSYRYFAGEVTLAWVASRPHVFTDITGSVGYDRLQAGSVRVETPGFGGPRTVSTQVLINGAWATSQTRTGVTGPTTLELTYGRGLVGDVRYRVVASGGGASAVSDPFVVSRADSPQASVAVTKSSATPAWSGYDWMYGTGDAVTVSGVVKGLPGPVTVTSQVQIKGKWAASQSTTTTTGTFSLPLTYGRGTAGEYRFRIVAKDKYGYTKIGPEKIIVRTASPRLSASSAGTKRINQTTSVWGSLTNAASVNRSVPITFSTQVLLNGKWSTSQQTKAAYLDVFHAGSSNQKYGGNDYTLPLTYGRGTVGTTRWRVTASYTLVNGKTHTVVSPEFTLTRTR
ncbi:hypothetical protein BW730_07730 [Tessaracoccus aquimaris]|uniref:IPT/TIG domain-containing protein n=1 Tax=Tessaracoccus aquimaris TaxID=1332264 RepID=A0A1Q2CMR1_9ACTN|nr:hypothetical protein [Tessaracoccus aquimaris]AQP47408.1 hypothetical protein BW730_07730 [Tessaracoccus aquimaris]